MDKLTGSHPFTTDPAAGKSPRTDTETPTSGGLSPSHENHPDVLDEHLGPSPATEYVFVAPPPLRPAAAAAPTAMLGRKRPPVLVAVEASHQDAPQDGILTPLGRHLPTPTLGIPLYDPSSRKKLGAGAFGVTSTVRDAGKNTFVLKEISLAAATERAQDIKFPSYKRIAEQTEKMRVEMKALKRLAGSRHFPALLGNQEEKGTLQIAMSLAPGKTLDQQKLSPSDVREVVRQSLEAMQYAHSKGVAILDFKPQNALFDRKSRRVTLIDLGEARLFEPGTDPHITENLSAGTAKYRPRTWSEDSPIRLDTFALGTTAKALFKEPNEIPLEAQNFIEQATKKDPPSLEELSQHPWLTRK